MNFLSFPFSPLLSLFIPPLVVFHPGSPDSVHPSEPSRPSPPEDRSTITLKELSHFLSAWTIVNSVIIQMSDDADDASSCLKHFMIWWLSLHTTPIIVINNLFLFCKLSSLSDKPSAVVSEWRQISSCVSSPSSGHPAFLPLPRSQPIKTSWRSVKVSLVALSGPMTSQSRLTMLTS